MGNLLHTANDSRYRWAVDPFDSVRPIGRVADPPVVSKLGSTAGLRNIRREVRRAQQVEVTGDETKLNRRTNRVSIPRRLGSRSRTPTARRAPLSFAELEDMASRIAESAYRDTQTLERPGDRKHAATSFAIVTDKLLLLRGRPTEILAITDELRPAAHDLAAKLALVRKPGAA